MTKKRRYLNLNSSFSPSHLGRRSDCSLGRPKNTPLSPGADVPRGKSPLIITQDGRGVRWYSSTRSRYLRSVFPFTRIYSTNQTVNNNPGRARGAVVLLYQVKVPAQCVPIHPDLQYKPNPLISTFTLLRIKGPFTLRVSVNIASTLRAKLLSLNMESLQNGLHLLPPVFVVCRKVMFSVCLSVHKGVPIPPVAPPWTEGISP